jgi:hypothetical protein
MHSPPRRAATSILSADQEKRVRVTWDLQPQEDTEGDRVDCGEHERVGSSAPAGPVRQAKPKSASRKKRSRTVVQR